MTSRFHLLVLLVGLVLAGCSGKPGGAADEAKKEKTVKVERKDLDFAVDVIGDLRPSVQVDVKAEVSGRVKTIPVEIGKTVKRGDLVTVLDDTDLLTEKSSTQVEIEGAELQLKKAASVAERAKQLVASDLISRQEADNARLDAEIAKNNLAKAVNKLQAVEDKLSKTRIMSPLNGSIIALPIIEGQVVLGGPSVGNGTLLMTLANLGEMLISTHINQIDVTRMKEGQPVQVTVDAFDTMKLSGKISFIAPMATIKNNIKGFGVDILVTTPDARVRPGMSADVKIPIARVERALSLPIEAVLRDNDKRIVHVKSGEKFEKREIEVGLTTNERVEIKKGLGEGETVLLIPPRNEASKH